LSSVLLVLCVCVLTTHAVTPKTVMELLQKQTTKKSAVDCAQCNQPNQFCDLRSWTGICKVCPVCGIDRFCDGRGYCQRCLGVYDKPTLACQRVTATDLRSDGQYVEGKAVKLAFSTVGDDLFYLSAEPNSTYTPPAPLYSNSSAPAANASVPVNSTGNFTEPGPPAPVAAFLSTTPSTHVIEEITAGSGQFRVRFDDEWGGFLHVIVPDDPEPVLLAVNSDIKWIGVSEVLRDFSQWTTFEVEHSASFSWRFRVGEGEYTKFLAWCGQATCGEGVPALRMMHGMYCGSLTTDGIRCDVMITN